VVSLQLLDLHAEFTDLSLAKDFDQHLLKYLDFSKFLAFYLSS